jgi:hypothetical protein
LRYLFASTSVFVILISKLHKHKAAGKGGKGEGEGGEEGRKGGKHTR